jgi:hypothetical protein
VAGNDYHFITRWRVRSTPEVVSKILENAANLTRWWPSVYLEVEVLKPGDERDVGVEFANDALSVALMDGRVITVPLVRYPRLLEATDAERNNWQISGGGSGIHWPDIDEDLSTEGLLRGAPAPRKQPAKKTP